MQRNDPVQILQKGRSEHLECLLKNTDSNVSLTPSHGDNDLLTDNKHLIEETDITTAASFQIPVY